MDVEFVEEVPQWGEGSGGVDVKAEFGDAEEPPAAAFEVALTGQIGFVGVAAVPGVAVAFDGQAGVGADHHEVDAVALDGELRDDAVAPVARRLKTRCSNRGIERSDPGVLGYRGRGPVVVVVGTLYDAAGVVEEGEAHVLGVAKLLEGDRVEQPHLVLGPGGGHVVALGVLGQGGETLARFGSGHHG
jgi:hypothetical protein